MNPKDWGHANEHRVEEAIMGNLMQLPLVARCYNANPGGELDGLGIDILIVLKNGLGLFLQIKSSPNRLSQHYRKHPFIPVIVVPRDRTPEDIVKEIGEIIDDLGKRFFTADTRERHPWHKTE